MRLHMLHGDTTESHGIEYMGLHMAEGIAPSTLFSCLGVTVDTVIVHWLHTMGQTVLAHAIANVL